MKALLIWTWFCCGFGIAVYSGEYATKVLKAEQGAVAFVAVVTFAVWPAVIAGGVVDALTDNS
jgi:hypothetical protein